MPKFTVEVTVFDALGKKLKDDMEKTLKGLSAVAAVLKDPDKILKAEYQLAIRMGMNYVSMRIQQLGLPFLLEPLYAEGEVPAVIGFKLVSMQQIPVATLNELIDYFLEGFGEALRQIVEGAQA